MENWKIEKTKDKVILKRCCNKCGIELTKKTSSIGSFSNGLCRKCKSKYVIEQRKKSYNKLPEE